jgi:hypothetical protein
MDFLELTALNGEKLNVVCQHVAAVLERPGGAKILLSFGATLEVQERRSEIVKQLKQR